MTKSMAMKTLVFGKPFFPGDFVVDTGRAKVRATVERIAGGFKITGTVGGRAGRIEVFRAPAPAEFLMNNWQSWGPIQKMKPGEKLEGLADRMASYSRFVFSPVPEAALRNLVSDYLIAWDGGLAGFLASRVAHPYFAVEAGEIVGILEYFDTPFEDPVPLEPFVVLEGAPAETLLETYADLAAAENHVRVRTWNPVGWSSWYQYFTSLRPGDLEKNLRLARGIGVFEVFQIDDGYERDIGDWLETAPGFGALDDLAAPIRDHGYIPGLWTAPTSVSATSRLAADHPDWLVGENGLPKPCYRNWKKEIYALDATRPEVRDWLSETFLALKRSGFRFFKIDFLFAGAMPGERLGRDTPVQAYRRGLRVIREAVGDDFLLGCGAPLLPSLGFVDGMRVGEDTAPFWDSAMSGIQGPNARIALKNPILRWFMHRRWWLNDPDCLLLRGRGVELAKNERELFARAAGVLDVMILQSDDLELVDGGGRELLREAVGLRGGRPRVAGVLDDDAYLLTSSGGPAGDVRLAANLSDSMKIVSGREIPPRTGLWV
jgi:alpha-galactosidase